MGEADLCIVLLDCDLHCLRGVSDRAPRNPTTKFRCANEPASLTSRGSALPPPARHAPTQPRCDLIRACHSSHASCLLRDTRHSLRVRRSVTRVTVGVGRETLRLIGGPRKGHGSGGRLPHPLHLLPSCGHWAAVHPTADHTVAHAEGVSTVSVRSVANFSNWPSFGGHKPESTLKRRARSGSPQPCCAVGKVGKEWQHPEPTSFNGFDLQPRAE